MSGAAPTALVKAALSKAGKPRPALRLLPEVRDRGFLPAALALVETPPSPSRVGMMLTICALAAGGTLWACVGQVEIYATARGKVEPAGHVKVVQPLETGRVVEVRVADGQSVAAGEVLLVLDAREAEADLAASSAAASAAAAEALRRGAEIAAVQSSRLIPPPVDWPADIPAATRLREEAVLAGDLSQLRATLANLADQAAEKQAAVAQLDGSIAAETGLLKPMAERVELRRTLYSEGNNSRLNLLDAEQTLLEAQSQVVTDTGRRDAARAAIATLASERARTIEAFLADDMQKLADARRQADEKGSAAARDRARVDHMTLRAPVAGVVGALSVTNPGQVVSAGQEVLRLVPGGAPLAVQAYVTNDDIGFVRPGQAAVIKVDSFPFTRFGTIEADVVAVAYDALPADQANHAVTDAAAPQHDDGPAPSATPLTNLVFETTVRPRALSIPVGDASVPLSPGMTVTVEITTGKRSVISYLTGALLSPAKTAFHER